jgi:hypothetical protein
MRELKLIPYYRFNVAIVSSTTFAVSKTPLIKCNNFVALLNQLLCEKRVSPRIVAISTYKLHYAFSLSDCRPPIVLDMQQLIRIQILHFEIELVNFRPLNFGEIDEFPLMNLLAQCQRSAIRSYINFDCWPWFVPTSYCLNQNLTWAFRFWLLLQSLHLFIKLLSFRGVRVRFDFSHLIEYFLEPRHIERFVCVIDVVFNFIFVLYLSLLLALSAFSHKLVILRSNILLLLFIHILLAKVVLVILYQQILLSLVLTMLLFV